MVHFKKYVCLLCFFSILTSVKGQKANEINTIIGKVLSMDNVLTDSTFYSQTNNRPKQYYYALSHIKIISAKKDTLLLCYVFNIKDQLKDAQENFGLMIDSIYKFTVNGFTPCNSDFPKILGCDEKLDNGKKLKGKYKPSTSSICKSAYKSINRIIEFSPIDEVLWERLINW